MYVFSSISLIIYLYGLMYMCFILWTNYPIIYFVALIVTALATGNYSKLASVFFDLFFYCLALSYFLVPQNTPGSPWIFPGPESHRTSFSMRPSSFYWRMELETKKSSFHYNIVKILVLPLKNFFFKCLTCFALEKNSFFLLVSALRQLTNYFCCCCFCFSLE